MAAAHAAVRQAAAPLLRGARAHGCVHGCAARAAAIAVWRVHRQARKASNDDASKRATTHRQRSRLLILLLCRSNDARATHHPRPRSRQPSAASAAQRASGAHTARVSAFPRAAMPPRNKVPRVKKLRKAPKGERNAARSRGGFLLAALAVAGAVAASLWCAAARRVSFPRGEEPPARFSRACCS
jgi:hypothetical protein